MTVTRDLPGCTRGWSGSTNGSRRRRPWGKPRSPCTVRRSCWRTGKGSTCRACTCTNWLGTKGPERFRSKSRCSSRTRLRQSKASVHQEARPRPREEGPHRRTAQSADGKHWWRWRRRRRRQWWWAVCERVGGVGRVEATGRGAVGAGGAALFRNWCGYVPNRPSRGSRCRSAWRNGKRLENEFRVRVLRIT